MNRPRAGDSAPVRACAVAAGAGTGGGAVMAVSGPHRRPPGPRPVPRRGKGGHRQAPAPHARGRGYPPGFTRVGGAGNAVGTDPAAATRPAWSPGTGIGTVVLQFPQRAEREDDRTADDLRPQVQAVQVPARDADQRPGRDRPHLHPRHHRRRPGVPGAALARGDAHQHVPAAGPRPAARQEQGGELASPPGPGGGDPQPGTPSRGLPPRQGQHVHVLIRHVTVRDRPPAPITGIARFCRHDCPPPVVLAVRLVPPGWLPGGPAGPARTGRGPGAGPPATISARLPAACQARARPPAGARPAGLDTARGVERGCCRSRAEGQPDQPGGPQYGRRRTVRQVRAAGRRPGPPPSAGPAAQRAAGPGREAAAVVSQALTLTEIAGLPAVTDLVTAGKALGLGRTKAYELARAGQFPCPVIRAGRTWLVPTAGLLAVLGLPVPGPATPR